MWSTIQKHTDAKGCINNATSDLIMVSFANSASCIVAVPDPRRERNFLVHSGLINLLSSGALVLRWPKTRCTNTSQIIKSLIYILLC